MPLRLGFSCFSIVENRVVFQTALPTECLGYACGSAVVAGIAVAAGMAGGAGSECGEGKDEEDMFHVSFSEWVGLRLGALCCCMSRTGWGWGWVALS